MDSGSIDRRSIRLGGTSMTDNIKDIYLAGGCFWGTEHFFKQVSGVVETQVGYANGITENPTGYCHLPQALFDFARKAEVSYQHLVLERLSKGG